MKTTTFNGNPHVRSDEREVASAKPARGFLLYKRLVIAVVAAVAMCGAGARADAPKSESPDEASNALKDDSSTAIEKERRVKEAAVVRKMMEIRLPSFGINPSVNPCRLNDAILFLRLASIDLDSPEQPREERGINIFRGYVFELDDGDNPVLPELSADDISIYDALKLVCESVGYTFCVRENFVVVWPKIGSLEDLKRIKHQHEIVEFVYPSDYTVCLGHHEESEESAEQPFRNEEKDAAAEAASHEEIQRRMAEIRRESLACPAILRQLMEVEGKCRTDGLWGTTRHTALLLLALHKHGEFLAKPESRDTESVRFALRSLSAKIMNGYGVSDEDRFVVACALAEAYAYWHNPDLIPALEHEVGFIVESQGADGLWGDSLRTVWAAMTLSAVEWSKIELSVEGLGECRARAAAQADRLVLDGRAGEMEVCAAVWLSRERRVREAAARYLADRKLPEALTEADAQIAMAKRNLRESGYASGPSWDIRRRVIKLNRTWEDEGGDSTCLHYLVLPGYSRGV